MEDTLIKLAKRKGTQLKCRNSVKDLSTLNFANACYKACNVNKKKGLTKLIGLIFILLLLFIKNLRFSDLQKFEA